MQTGVADLPGDRTVQTPTRFPDPAEPDDSGLAVRPVSSSSLSSDELAMSSRKMRRRQRDRRAESRAVQVLIALFVGLGGSALLAVNLLLEDPPPAAAPATDPTQAGAQKPSDAPPAGSGAAVAPPPDRVISSPLVEHVDLPALRQLRNEGLTIAAEGLPEVTTAATGASVGLLAARETCRFAYGIWEFSPNKRFRFLPTCPSLDGQVLFGAYSVQGGVIRMSPLRVAGDELLSRFEVEKPSRLLTQVTVGTGGQTFEVRQRVTVIRSGLFGDAFFNTYAAKNTLSIPGASPRRVPSPPPKTAPGPSTSPPSKRDPLLDLLRGTKKP